MSDDYQKGYAEGFSAGFRSGLEAGKAVHPSPYVPTYPNDWPGVWSQPKGTTCSKCGMFFELNKPYGYVCPYNGCPSKVSK